MWRRADGYVTITAALARELEGALRRRGRASRSCPTARACRHVDGVGLRPDAGTAGPVVGYAGHLYPWKGPDVLLAALERLPGVRALIVGGLAGEPDLDRVRALADRVAPGRVTFAGQVDPPRVAGLLRQADVLVLPNTPSRVSAAYTSPLKLFEYMASGRPIVASDLPALREVLRPDENAILVEAGNADALAAGICAACSATATLASRLAARGPRATCGSGPWDERAERHRGAARRGGDGEAGVISSRLLELVRCPDCGGPSAGAPPELACGACARAGSPRTCRVPRPAPAA